MHELSLVTSIFEIITPQIPHGEELTEVHMIIGPLSGVSIESLKFSFEIIADKNGLGRANLLIINEPAKIRCLGCKKEYTIPSLDRVCPHCQSLQREILSGDEFYIDSIKVERE